MSEWTTDDLTALKITGATDDEMRTIRRLLSVWRDRLQRNQQRSMYYDGDQAFKDLGLALPPQLKNAKFYLGWATQAVRKPAARSQFEGFRLPGVKDPFDLNTILEQNRFGLEFSQATVDAGKHGMALTTVAKGGSGEPDVQIQAHSVESSSAIWNRRRRWIEAALTISELNKDANPTEFIVYLDSAILHCSKADGTWKAERTPNQIGRTLVVPVPHDPQLKKPFGRSRITPPVMALTDMAVRAYVRMEGNAEFYSTPQLAVEGIDPDAFDGDVNEQRKFKLAMDRLIALTRDADGNAPTIKQLQQATMQPHSDMLRTVAMAFAGETGIPAHSLGILHDQPASAEAIRAGEHDLLVDVSYQNKYVLSQAAADQARLAVMVRDGLTEPPKESWNLSVRFADPEFRSTTANAVGFTQLAGAVPDLVYSDVMLETVFDSDQVERLQEYRTRAAAGDSLRALLNGGADKGAPDGVEGGPGAVQASE